MNELNKKLAERVGFTIEYLRVKDNEPPTKYGSGVITGFWRRSNNSLVKLNQLNFTHSLDACFNWLVPKAIDKIIARLNWSKESALDILFANWRHELRDEVEQPALALCKAIEKLIDEDGS